MRRTKRSKDKTQLLYGHLSHHKKEICGVDYPQQNTKVDIRKKYLRHHLFSVLKRGASDDGLKRALNVTSF